MDKHLISMLKNTVRQFWQRSAAYKKLINKANYTCKHCGKKYTNKSRLYIEHIVPLEIEYTKAVPRDCTFLPEIYFLLISDYNNIEVWGSECCKSAKDKADRKLIKEFKNNETK